MEEERYDVFISYRRIGGKDNARLLKAELEKRRLRVFLDFDDLKDGVFDKRIENAIQNSAVFIFILSKNSLDRCIDETDWVRKEIICAHESHCHIVPVEFDKSFREIPRIVPSVIQDILGAHSWAAIDTENLLNASVNQMLEENVAPYIDHDISLQSDAVVPQKAEVYITADVDCECYRFNKYLGTVRADKDFMIRLIPGSHNLRFVAKDNPDVHFDLKKYEVSDLFFSYVIEVKLKDLLGRQKMKGEDGQRVEENRQSTRVHPLRGTTQEEREEALRKFEEEGRRKAEEAVRREALLNIDYEPFEQFGKWGYIDKAGRVVIRCQWEFADDFSEGLAKVKDKQGLYGFVDATGNCVIPCKWKFAFEFSEGLAAVKNAAGLCGYIDRQGREVIPCQWKNAYIFSEGLAAVKDGADRWGYINKKGSVIIPCTWKGASTFSEGLVKVQDEKRRWGYIDKTGRKVIPCRWKSAYSFAKGQASVRNDDGEWHKIDKTGQVVR